MTPSRTRKLWRTQLIAWAVAVVAMVVLTTRTGAIDLVGAAASAVALVAACFALWLGVRMAHHRLRAGRRREAGCCIGCGHVLTAGQGACPECGKPRADRR
jgi:hypothetical protein